MQNYVFIIFPLLLKTTLINVLIIVGIKEKGISTYLCFNGIIINESTYRSKIHNTLLLEFRSWALI